MFISSSPSFSHSFLFPLSLLRFSSSSIFTSGPHSTGPISAILTYSNPLIFSLCSSPAIVYDPLWYRISHLIATSLPVLYSPVGQREKDSIPNRETITPHTLIIRVLWSFQQVPLFPYQWPFPAPFLLLPSRSLFPLMQQLPHPPSAIDKNWEIGRKRRLMERRRTLILTMSHSR